MEVPLGVAWGNYHVRHLVWAGVGFFRWPTGHTSFLLPVTTSSKLSTMLNTILRQKSSVIFSHRSLYRGRVLDGDRHGHLTLSKKAKLQERQGHFFNGFLLRQFLVNCCHLVQYACAKSNTRMIYIFKRGRSYFLEQNY